MNKKYNRSLRNNSLLIIKNNKKRISEKNAKQRIVFSSQATPDENAREQRRTVRPMNQLWNEPDGNGRW
jgi:hypothetical protein